MARGIDGGPVGRDALVRSMSTWRGWNELRGEPQVSWWGPALGETGWVTARSLLQRERPRRLKRGIRRDVDEKVTHRSRHTI